MTAVPQRAALLAALLLRAALSAADPAPATDACLVEVLATYQQPDARIPWRRDPPRGRQGVGVLVGPGEVLTTETVVRHQTQVELRRAKSGRKVTAAVIQADAQRNLALLRAADPEVLAPGSALAFADIAAVAATVTLVSLQPSGETQASPGQVVELTAAGGPRPLVMKVLTSLTLDRPGAPALRDGRLAGLCYAYDQKTQMALCLPGPALAAFVADARAAVYRGLAWAGFQFEPLLDPVQRRYLGAPRDARGVRITRVTPGSGAAGVLRADDVLLAWDGVALDAQGYYADPRLGRLHMAYLIGGRRAPGETATVALIRDRAMLTARVPLVRRREAAAFIPEPDQDAPVEYLVDGGLVLRPLDGDYLKAAGESWTLQNNPRLVHYFLNQDQVARQPGNQVVILALVLPDQVNIGYQELRDEVVTAVNGRPVRRMADVFEAADAAGGLARVSLLGYGVDLVLDPAARAEANRRIAAQYRIPSLRYRAAGD